jgi:geranylgeranyl diphosphate synthase type II
VAVSTIDDQPDIDFERLRPQIDAALARYVEFDDDCPPRLAEAIRYALLAPGKRLRPQLVLMAAEACGGSIETAIPAACAVEMVHAYSLVHDDLPAMDDDDLRRGRPTCHKVFGEAVAILVGDALLARAFEVLASEVQPPGVASQCCVALGRAAGATALVGGQAADLEAAASPVSEGDGVRELESIHRRKTGALFVASLELGAIVSGASNEQRTALISYGRSVGLAFQITDDLLDVSGFQSTVGKRVAKDAGHGKRTYPALLGIEESRRRARALVVQACDMMEIFGNRGQSLRALAQFVCRRES